MLSTLVASSCFFVTLGSFQFVVVCSCLFVTLSSTFARCILLWFCVIGLVAFYIPLCFGVSRARPPLLGCLRATAFLKGPGNFYGL